MNPLYVGIQISSACARNARSLAVAAGAILHAAERKCHGAPLAAVHSDESTNANVFENSEKFKRGMTLREKCCTYIFFFLSKGDRILKNKYPVAYYR